MVYVRSRRQDLEVLADMMESGSLRPVEQSEEGQCRVPNTQSHNGELTPNLASSLVK